MCHKHRGVTTSGVSLFATQLLMSLSFSSLHSHLSSTCQDAVSLFIQLAFPIASSFNIQCAQDFIDDHVIGDSISFSSPVSSPPRHPSAGSRSIGSSSLPLAFSEGRFPGLSDDVNTGWLPTTAPDPTLSPPHFPYPSPLIPRYSFPIPSSSLSPIDGSRASELNGGCSSHLPYSSTFHSPIVQSSITTDPIPAPAALISNSQSDSESHLLDLHFTHSPHSSSPYSSYGSNHLRPSIDETCSTERKEVSLYSPTDSRAVKRPRPCSPLWSPSTTSVPFYPNIGSLVKSHHEVWTAQENVYCKSEGMVVAKFYADPSSIRLTSKYCLDLCLQIIGKYTSTESAFQCGTIAILASGRPVDVERALDVVQFLMVYGIRAVVDSGLVVALVLAYLWNEEHDFLRGANGLLPQLMGQKTVFSFPQRRPLGVGKSYRVHGIDER